MNLSSHGENNKGIRQFVPDFMYGFATMFVNFHRMSCGALCPTVLVVHFGAEFTKGRSTELFSKGLKDVLASSQVVQKLVNQASVCPA